MYILLVVIVLVVLYLIFSNSRKQSNPRSRATSSSQRASSPAKISVAPVAEDFLPPIPKGYQIFADRIPIAGIQFRRDDILKFCHSTNQELVLEREPDNEHDPKAIKLFGVASSGRHFIGYVPKELAEQIVATELFAEVKPRLGRIYVSNTGFIDIQYQIIGPKASKKTFDGFLDDQPADSSQKDFLRFFNVAIPKGLTAGDADKLINETRRTCAPEVIKEWESLDYIQLDFDDKDFREVHEIKKVSKTILDEALKQLKGEGKSYTYLYGHIEEIVARVKKLKPELEGQM